MRVIVTGGAGFIGSSLVHHIVNQVGDHVLNIDKLTYAGNLESLLTVSQSDKYQFVQGDVCDYENMKAVFIDFQPNIVMHLAAESHVDRSIDGPAGFIQSNIIGTYTLLEVARSYWGQLEEKRKENFRFHHISTDEVYGSLGHEGLFTESSLYDPSSPYSASKASSDHLVRAWHRTYGLPALITNCSNNYGPRQFPEKLIPLMILNALDGKSLPVYGNGQQVRDWLYVDDHVRALYQVACQGKVGETYNIGGHNEKTNLEVIHELCAILDRLRPDHPKGISSYHELIEFVPDRPGHDQRYAIDASKIERELGWVPQETFETGLEKTVRWYLDNEQWWRNVLDGSYQGERLGVMG